MRCELWRGPTSEGVRNYRDRVTAPIKDIWREKIRGSVTGEATRRGIAARPTTQAFAQLTHHAERRIGPRYDDIIGFNKTLCKADRAAGLDHRRLDGEPLSDARAADEIDREADCHR